MLFWLLLLFVLICISAFFSSSETGMMSVNKYKVRHASKEGNKAARRVLNLLQRPDRLLGMILIGNTVANILATSVATMLAVKLFGELGLVYVTIVLSIVILVFAETMPKTIAAIYSEKLAYAVSMVLVTLLRIFSPLVAIVNWAANSVMLLMGIDASKRKKDSLSVDELETVVHDATQGLDKAPRNMLLRMLSLEDVVVEDVMIPRADIVGLDISLPWNDVLKHIKTSTNIYLPVYVENINDVLGMLRVHKALHAIVDDKFSIDLLQDMLEPAYFIPETTPIDKQLMQFQQKQQRIGLVVDEYGEVMGLITIKDILEEIVGEFSDEDSEDDFKVDASPDGSYTVDAGIYVRELHRITEWNLPLDGAATLSGLIIEYLQYIPKYPMCVKLAGYPMEILAFDENTIEEVRVWPRLYRESVKDFEEE